MFVPLHWFSTGGIHSRHGSLTGVSSPATVLFAPLNRRSQLSPLSHFRLLPRSILFGFRNRMETSKQGVTATSISGWFLFAFVLRDQPETPGMQH